MVVSEGSMSFDLWSDLPMPMYMKVYYYNCTNHQDVQDYKAKPLLKQIGPYVFLEKHHKSNITFHDNNQTVSFYQQKNWMFEPDMSNGTLDDILVTLNVLAVTAADSTRWPNGMFEGDYPFLRVMMDGTFKETKEELFMKTNIRNITFDGIESDLLTMTEEGPMAGVIEMPFDKFGWFYGRNGSDTYDGEYEMWTGEGNLQNVGQISRWQGEPDLSRFYPSPCSHLSGSAGEFFPPNRDKSSVSYFTPDLCRTIFFNYKEETEVQGISGYKYWLDTGFIANSTYNSSNVCYNPHPDLVQQPKDQAGNDLPDIRPIEDAIVIGLYDGLLNVTSCKFNAPSYVSFPHFYKADPALMEPFDPDSDFWPNEEQHESYISLMPKPGIPLDVAVRMQINILVRPLEYISIMEDINTMFFPMIWFETTTELSDDLVSQLKLLEIAPKLGNITGGISVGIGAVLALTAAFMIYNVRRNQFV